MSSTDPVHTPEFKAQFEVRRVRSRLSSILVRKFIFCVHSMWMAQSRAKFSRCCTPTNRSVEQNGRKERYSSLSFMLSSSLKYPPLGTSLDLFTVHFFIDAGLVGRAPSLCWIRACRPAPLRRCSLLHVLQQLLQAAGCAE
jgi:hypothetical protein